MGSQILLSSMGGCPVVLPPPGPEWTQAQELRGGGDQHFENESPVVDRWETENLEHSLSTTKDFLPRGQSFSIFFSCGVE